MPLDHEEDFVKPLARALAEMRSGREVYKLPSGRVVRVNQMKLEHRERQALEHATVALRREVEAPGKWDRLATRPLVAFGVIGAPVTLVVATALIVLALVQ